MNDAPSKTKIAFDQSLAMSVMAARALQDLLSLCWHISGVRLGRTKFQHDYAMEFLQHYYHAGKIPPWIFALHVTTSKDHELSMINKFMETHFGVGIRVCS